MPTRLVAIKLSQEQASERIRKAKKTRDKRLNHSKEYYKALHYVIFITNVETEKCCATEISELYRIRWRIEILFKSWKSGIKIEKLLPDATKKTERIESIIYMLILYITWFEQKILAPLQLEKLSILKLTKEIARNIYYYMLNELSHKTIRELIYKCSYETRRRPNANKWFDEFIESSG